MYVLGSAAIDRIKITSGDPVLSVPIFYNSNGSIPRPYIMTEESKGMEVWILNPSKQMSKCRMGYERRAQGYSHTRAYITLLSRRQTPFGSSHNL